MASVTGPSAGGVSIHGLGPISGQGLTGPVDGIKQAGFSVEDIFSMDGAGALGADGIGAGMGIAELAEMLGIPPEQLEALLKEFLAKQQQEQLGGAGSSQPSKGGGGGG